MGLFWMPSRPEKADLLFKEMVEEGVAPNEKTFGALIDAWVRAGNYDKAFEVLSRLKHHGIPMNGVLGYA